MMLVSFALGSRVASGCGLISSDVTNFDLDLPAQDFTVDAASWKVDSTAATRTSRRAARRADGVRERRANARAR